MAQLGARLNGIEKVEGSNPSGSTPNKKRLGDNVKALLLLLALDKTSPTSII